MSGNEEQKAEDLSVHLEKLETDLDDFRKDEGHEHHVIEGYTPAEQRKIIHKVDRRLITWLGILYCIALLDRINLPNANIAGMAADLELIGNRYNILNLSFFPLYIVAQLPSTVIVRKFGPRICITVVVTAWGAVMIGMGFVDVWFQMIPLRILLGIFEAFFFPSCLWLISAWYARYNVHKRYAWFYVISIMSQAFSGILAYGFSQMGGLGGVRGWRWIFIMEGILTVILGLLTYVILVDFPEKAYGAWQFLSDREVRFVVARINEDRDDAELERFSIAKYLRAGLDFKVWCFATIYFTLTATAYAVAFALPIILRQGMGMSLVASQCLVAPPYAFSAILLVLSSWIGDKYRARAPILIILGVLTIIGLPLIGWAKSNAVRYLGVFLTAGAVNANVPAAMAYQANNIRGQWKRAFCSATFVSAGAVGGIAGSLVFRTQDAPMYRPGIWACVAFQLLMFTTVTFLSVKFHFANKRASAGGKLIAGLEGFRYTL